MKIKEKDPKPKAAIDKKDNPRAYFGIWRPKKK